jgi:hypothetical protein
MQESNEHSVVICFDYGLEDWDPYYELSEKLGKAIEEAKTGFYDGHEMAMDNSDGSFYMYGPNAEILFKTVKPILEQSHFLKNVVARLRFGPIDADVPYIDIDIEKL